MRGLSKPSVASRPAVREKASLLPLTGFGTLAGDVEQRMIAAQLRWFDRMTPFRLGLTLFGILFIWKVFARTVPVTVLTGWSAAATGTIILALYYSQRWRRSGYAAATPRDIRIQGLSGVTQGLLWLSAMYLLSRTDTPEQQIALWTLVSVMMICGAITYAAAPVAATGFLAFTAFGGFFMFDDPAQAPLRALAVSYALSLLIGCVVHARAFARNHSTTAELTEKSEIVSLLLREYEKDASDWLWLTDASRRINGASPRFAANLGLNAAQLEGMPILQALAGKSWESGNFSSGLRDLAEHLKQREPFSNLTLQVHVGNHWRWWELSASPRYNEDGAFIGYRGVGSDVTAQHESAAKITQLAHFDPLTGLPNRQHLHETLDGAIATTASAGGRICAFLMLDLDRFKAVNDSLGHPVGDKLLGQVAGRLRQLCSANEFSGRIGGDEFGIVIRDAAATPDHVARFANNVIHTLSQPYQVDEHVLHIGTSVGSALWPADGRSSEALVRNADLALYRAKGEGGGTHCPYEPQLHALAEERRVLEVALREALEQDQLHVLYQPVVDGRTSDIVGFEALVRWTHPDMGVIAPARFVPVAEDARLIAPIGEWVLRTACNEAAHWPDHVPIAVNVSAQQLTNPNFVGLVASTLAQSGIAPSRLELEVTESVFMSEDTGALKVLDQIRSLGVRLSLDDFGTGYSSLGYLSRIRFDTIKIDRSFVVGAANRVTESLAIIRAVVTLADSLGISTTAEGVETEDELRMVNSLGCTKVQGYYFGRPMVSEDTRRLFGLPPRTQVRA